MQGPHHQASALAAIVSAVLTAVMIFSKFVPWPCIMRNKQGVQLCLRLVLQSKSRTSQQCAQASAHMGASPVSEASSTKARPSRSEQLPVADNNHTIWLAFSEAAAMDTQAWAANLIDLHATRAYMLSGRQESHREAPHWPPWREILTQTDAQAGTSSRQGNA